MQDYDAAKVPTHAMAYVYIGKMADTAITDSSGSGQSITVKDEGTSRTSDLSSLNFVGAGITATASGSNITVTVPGVAGMGGVTYGRTIASANMTSSASDKIIGVTATGSIEVRLASANTLSAGQFVTVKKEVGSSNIITISASGSNKIDGIASIELESPYGAVNLYSDGTGSYFIY